MMKLVEFYRGERPNNEGLFIDDIMAYTYERLEVDHAYIQWLLPLRERSMFNTEAPLLKDEEIELFQSDPELRAKVAKAAYKMMDYFGMYIHGGEVRWQESDPQYGHANPQWWLKHFNHNFLRMTRYLTSLRYLGHEALSKAIYDCLLASRHLYGQESYEYWTEAATGPLP